MADDSQPFDVPPSHPNPHSSRLRIHHFLIWIAITAALLTLSRSLVESWEKTHPDFSGGYNRSGWAWSYIALGGEVTILFCVINGWWRGSLGRIQPGEWLAILGVVEGGTSLIQSMIFVFGASPDDVNGIRLIGAIETISYCSYLPWFFVFTRLVVASKENAIWRIVYALLVIEKAPVLLNPILWRTVSRQSIVSVFYRSVFSCVHWVWLPAVCVAACSDWKQHRQRRWTQSLSENDPSFFLGF